MLCIVDLTDEKKRIFEKFRKHSIEIRRADSGNAQPVFMIKSHRHYTDFEMLKKAINRYGKALFVSGIMPDGFEDILFTAQKLPLKMLVKTAADFYSLQPKSSRKIVLSVFDKTGCACDEIALLCRYVRSVRVITSKIEAYETCAQNVFSACGACMLVSGSEYTAAKSDVVIAPDDSEICSIDFKKAIVYKKRSEKANVFEMNECRANVDFAGFEIEGIDKYTLLCALYEECGYKIKSIPVFYGANILKE